MAPSPSSRHTQNRRCRLCAHDLVDLQILEHEEPINKSALAKIATQLYKARDART